LKCELIITKLSKEIEELNTKNRDLLFEYEIITDLLNNASKIYKNGTYVQKRKINEILFLNIKITSDNGVIIAINEGLQNFFNLNGAERQN
jgi:hypothetical protein